MRTRCTKCGETLDDPGALVFSPPDPDSVAEGSREVSVEKFHICVFCWNDLLGWLLGEKRLHG